MSEPRYLRQGVRPDTLCVLTLAIIGAAVSACALAQLNERLYLLENQDLWFQADAPRTFANLIQRNGQLPNFGRSQTIVHPWLSFLTERDGQVPNLSHARTIVHPLFSLIFYPLCQLVMALGVEPLAAAKTLVVAAAALTTAFFYLALRNLGLAMTAAAAFSLALIASATFIHWFAIVDTYAFGALSIALMLYVLTRPKPVGALTWVLSSAATFAVTITNWSFGIAATFFRLPRREFIRISALALAVVVPLSFAQKLIFPSSRLFFDPRIVGEVRFVGAYEEIRGTGEWQPLANLRSMLLFSAVAPTPMRVELREQGVVKTVVSNQKSSLGGYGPGGIAAAALWAVVLGLGLRGLWGAAVSRRPGVALALGAFGAGQVALHLVYGSITFLYAAHYFPAFMAIAAFGALTSAGLLAALPAAAFAVLAGYNNWHQFVQAAWLLGYLVAGT
jgi:hypothetical protein